MSNSVRPGCQIGQDVFSVPDRMTGESSWKELCLLTPGRAWRFVKVDVWMAEYLKYKDQIIELMRPNFTVMDLSIAAALFFAARGIGRCMVHATLDTEPFVQAYHSPARVFISGLGADELMAGYSRHRSAFFSPSSWESLIDELQMDIDRISTRNLGRDDRIISHFGREARYPFLDLQVLRTLASLPVHLKCDLELGKGIGDKLLLRVLARELGLQQTSRLEKRAIQFGARSAKLEGLAKGTAEVLCSKAAGPLSKAHDSALSMKHTFFTSRQRLTDRQVKELFSTLRRTEEDERSGHSPQSLELSKLIFTSFPVGQTVMIAHPSDLDKAKKLSAASQNVVFASKAWCRRAKVRQKGIGMLANRMIPMATVIVSERPVLITPERLDGPSREKVEEIYLAAFYELPFEHQLDLAALTPAVNDSDEPTAGHAVVKRILKYQIPVSFSNRRSSEASPYPYSAVCPVTGQVNHTCRPNAHWHFDPSTFALTLCAVREIEEGEEVSVSLIDHLGSRAERQERLVANWGFECRCDVCQDGCAESDASRQLLTVERAFVQELLQAPTATCDLADCQQLIRRLKQAISLAQQEGLHEQLGLFGRALARTYVQCGMVELARATAIEYGRIVDAVDGRGSLESVEMERIAGPEKEVVD